MGQQQFYCLQLDGRVGIKQNILFSCKTFQNLTWAPVNHQACLCWTWRATEVENKTKTVLVPPWVKNRAVEFGFVFSLSQPFEGQMRRSRFICSKPMQGFFCLGGNSTSCWILVQQHLPNNVSTRRCYEFNCHSSLTAAPVGVAVLHQQLVGEDARQVERPRAFHILRHEGRAQCHPYVVFFCEGEGTGQLDSLGTEGFDREPLAVSHLVDAVAPNLVVLHVADLEEEGRVGAAGASLEVFVC